MRYIYIHGFNSGPQSRSGSALETMLDTPVIRAHNDYSRPFAECLASLEEFIISRLGPADKLCVMGTSLGGFYALQLRLPQIAKVAAWNPVIFPALQLGRFVGENTRFTDNQKWIFSREAQLSYAKAADAREWRNFYWQGLAVARRAEQQPTRQIYIGINDDLLDHEVGEAYWAGHAPVRTISSGHSIESFEHAREYLLQT